MSGGYRPGLDMGLNEFALERAIMELAQQRETFDYFDIADYIGCSRRTVASGMKRLLLADRVIAIGSRRGGYRYEVIGEAIAYA